MSWDDTEMRDPKWVARRLCVSVRTVRKWFREGRLRGKKFTVGRSGRIHILVRDGMPVEGSKTKAARRKLGERRASG